MKFKFQVGDRVARRPRAELNVAASASAKKAFNSSTRQSLHGTVTGFTTKTNSRGATRKFIQVKWDDSSSASEHEQMRLCFASELNALNPMQRGCIMSRGHRKLTDEQIIEILLTTTQ